MPVLDYRPWRKAIATISLNTIWTRTWFLDWATEDINLGLEVTRGCRLARRMRTGRRTDERQRRQEH